MAKSKIVHLRDSQLTDSPIYFNVRMPRWQGKVTCKICLRMMARYEKHTGVPR